LVLRVAGGGDREAFFESGRQSVRDLTSALAVIGRTLESYDTVLEFGCGCGRIITWMEEVAKVADLHGVDIDERAIRWASDNLPYATFKVNSPLPPLDYPDATFDLVYNHSVFTHLDEDYQDQWLAELRRVTKPGGTILLTVHGDSALRYYEDLSAKAGGESAWLRNQVQRDGIAFVRQDSNLGGPFPDFYHSTFHAPWYVFDRWGRQLSIQAYLSSASLGFQDIVLMQRPPDDAPPTPVGGSPPVPVAGADAEAPPHSSPTTAELPAVAEARARVDLGPDLDSATSFGPAARVARRVVLRALAHYDEHQRRVQQSLLDAIGQVHEAVASHVHPEVAAEELTLRETDARLADALRLQGERVNRLEADLWKALDGIIADGPPNG